MPSWYNSPSSDCLMRRYDSSTSTQDHNSNNYGSSHLGHESYNHGYNSSRTTYQLTDRYDDSRRGTYTTNKGDRYRDVSPLRSYAEHPRGHASSRNHFKDDGRVSPLGSFCFEKPS